MCLKAGNGAAPLRWYGCQPAFTLPAIPGKAASQNHLWRIIMAHSLTRFEPVARLLRGDPLREFDDFFSDMRLPFLRSDSAPRMKLDVKETGQGYKVMADLPGVKREDIKVNIDRAHVSISASTESIQEQEAANMIFFFFNDTPTTEIYTLSLHDALPIWKPSWGPPAGPAPPGCRLLLWTRPIRSEEHTSELQSRFDIVCRLLLEKKK